MRIAQGRGVRLVLDTNTALSGLLWGGVPGRLIDGALDSHFELLSSAGLLAELQSVMARAKFASRLAQRRFTIAEIIVGYSALVLLVEPAAIPPTILRDPPDDLVLATAVAENADLIVSDDHDLLDLGNFRDIPIVAPAEAIRRIPTWP